MNDLAELLAPPSEAVVGRAIAGYVRDLTAACQDRLVGVYLFGSRARGDHRPDSDADIVVVLSEFQGSALDEKMLLIDLGFDALTDAGVMIQPWPFTLAQWERREAGGRFADLLDAAKRGGVRLEAIS